MAGNDRVQIEHLKQFFIRDITQMGHVVRTTEEEKTIDNNLLYWVLLWYNFERKLTESEMTLI